MDRNITATLHRNASSNIHTLKLWGGDMTAWSYSATVRTDPVTGEPIGQFSHIVPVMIDENGNQIKDSSANTLFSRLMNPEWLQIGKLQTANSGYAVDQIMSWLSWYGTGMWGAPVRATYSPGNNWQGAFDIQLIGAAWAGQQVRIINTQKFPKIVYNNKQFTDVTLYRIQTFQPSDWGKTYKTHPYLVQEVTAVDKFDHPILPHGHIYCPLILDRAASCWVFEDWLQ